MSPMSITPSAASRSPHRSASQPGSAVDDFALTPAERTLLAALNTHGVRFLVIGLGAAVLQGAPVSTQDLDLWFERPGDDAVGGEGLDRLDTVLTAHGLDDFAAEYARALDLTVDGIAVKVLPLERVIVSKRSTGRPKDLAALPALEATLRARDGDVPS
jgi:hypothetical protein